MSRTAIVAGGTGLVGGHLVDLMISSKDYSDITLLVRKDSSYKKEGISTIEVDYDNLMDYEKSLKADVIFCCLGTTIKKAGSKEKFRLVDFSYPLELAKIALKNESKQFNIVTASGANSSSMFFYNRVKGEVEKALTELEFKNLNIFRPSLLLGKRKEQRFGEEVGAVISKVVNPLLVGPLRKYRAIQAEVVAKAMLQVSIKNASDGKTYESDNIQKIGGVS